MAEIAAWCGLAIEATRDSHEKKTETKRKRLTEPPLSGNRHAKETG
jgi:hypothetical protein